MKPVALFSLFTGLAASIGVIVLTIKSVVKSGKAGKKEKMILIFLPIFALVLIANIILAFLYF